METIQEGDTIEVLCKGKLKDGTVFFQTEEQQPLKLKVGEGRLLLAVEEKLVGMKPGETKTIEIPPEKAFGPYNEKLVLRAPKESFNPDFTPTPGVRVAVEIYPGRRLVGTIVDLDDKTVTIDFNHPLAGKTLIFIVTIVSHAAVSNEN